MSSFAARAAVLTGSFATIPQGSNIQLSAEGKLDWVHWGLQTDSSINRKSGVAAQISDFTVLYNTNFSYAAAYRYADNFNGYSWGDGSPTTAVTNTPTGVYVLRAFNPIETNGFEFTVPADTTVKTLKVYVGTFAARGRFQASLDEMGVLPYVNTNLSNAGNGPCAVYTIDFAANSPGKKLTIRWTVIANSNSSLDANVTLQAAVLTAAGANNPPFVSMTSPTNHLRVAAGSQIAVSADGGDLDGTISNVAFYSSETLLGQAGSFPATINWNVPAGIHTLTARATDNGGKTSLSKPVEIFAHGNGGQLSGAMSFPSSWVDLTAEGIADWAHWGHDATNRFNRKANVTARIGDFTQLGTNTMRILSDHYSTFAWNDGAPVINASVRNAVFVYGMTNGFQLAVPADTQERSLKIYTSLYGAGGTFQSWLSDFSAPAFTHVAGNVFGNSYAVYTLNFAAATSGQTLFVRYKTSNLFDFDFGNVALAAAALSQSGVLSPALFDVHVAGGDIHFSFFGEPGANYTVQFTDSLLPTSWQTLTNLPGNGGPLVVTDGVTENERYYRVLAQ